MVYLLLMFCRMIGSTPPLVVPQLSLASLHHFVCSSCIVVRGVGHFVILLIDWYYFSNLPMHFGDLKPSVTSEDLAWPVTGRKSPVSKNKYMNQHLSHKQETHQ